MSNESIRVNALFHLYLNNTITHDEYQELLLLLNPETLDNSFTSALKKSWDQADSNQVTLPAEIWDEKINYLLEQINNKEKTNEATVIRMPVWHKLRWAAAAAVFLLLFSSGVYFFIKDTKNNPVNISKELTNQVVLPGGDKAILILADGTSVILDNSGADTIAHQGSVSVLKLGSGHLLYNSSNEKPSSVSYNLLSTPRGGKYQVTLEDGTIAWLNSNSSIRYPAAFIGNERKVEVTGEVYFEVAKNKQKPFKVKINLSAGDGGEIEVLGTHFNINAYEDEESVRTTLLEGSVKLKHLDNSTLLKPGQQFQSRKTGQARIVNDIDLVEVIAWKEGRFQFDNADISYVMRQLARWYDIEVKYKGNISQHFGGTISRNEDMLKVLNMLELTGAVKFKINGNVVTVIQK